MYNYRPLPCLEFEQSQLFSSYLLFSFPKRGVAMVVAKREKLWLWRWWILQCFLCVRGDVSAFRDLGSMPKETQKVFALAAKKADALAENAVQQECLEDMAQSSSWPESKRKQCCEEMGLGCSAPPPPVEAPRKQHWQKLVFDMEERTVALGEEFQFVIPLSITADVKRPPVLRKTATLESGEDLPYWLKFDPGPMSFSGAPDGTIVLVPRTQNRAFSGESPNHGYGQRRSDG
eukprot:symbB.v1.2.027045.t1/scaffold2748.1/size71683/4